MSEAPRERSLSDAKVGERLRVVRVAGAGGLRTRLLELGVLPGTTIEVVRIAPLGDPLELRLRGYALSIRRADAGIVTVEPT